jgi:GNAT superfamily N-acetyltransferase
MSLPKRTPRRAGSDMPGLVIPGEAADLEVLSQVIADAFCDLPPSRWLVPDQDARREIFPGSFRVYVEHAMASGVVHTTTDRTAVALWLPVGENPAGPPANYSTRLAAATGPRIDRFLAFDATLDQHHPAGIPHHHLAILAVRPDRQGQGTGSLLLRAYHQVLDRDGVPAYLEAADLRTRQLYLRHGYADRPGAPFCLPDGGPAMWPMWREPQPGPARQEERSHERAT